MYICKSYFHKHYTLMRILCGILPGKCKTEKFSKLLSWLNKSKVNLSTDNNYFCIYSSVLRLSFLTFFKTCFVWISKRIWKIFKKKNRIIKYYFDTKRIQFAMMIRKRRALSKSKRIKYIVYLCGIIPENRNVKN